MLSIALPTCDYRLESSVITVLSYLPFKSRAAEGSHGSRLQKGSSASVKKDKVQLENL